MYKIKLLQPVCRLCLIQSKENQFYKDYINLAKQLTRVFRIWNLDFFCIYGTAYGYTKWIYSYNKK